MKLNLYEQKWFKGEELGEGSVQLRRTLPRGVNHLAPELVLQAQKERLIEAVAECIHKKGYAATSVKDIIQQASVSRTTFYKLFIDKEACYFHCFKKLSSLHLRLLIQTYNEHQKDVRWAFEVSTLAFIQQLTVNKIYASAFFALAPYSTLRVVAELNVVKAHYVSLLVYWFSILPSQMIRPVLPPDVFKIVIEGCFSYIRQWIIQGQQQSTESVHHHVCYVIFSALGLNDWARQHLEKLI